MLYLHSENKKFVITLDAVIVVFSERREQCFHTFFHILSFPRGLVFSQKNKKKRKNLEREKIVHSKTQSVKNLDIN